MNYQHIYHAGSSADVFKHLTIIALLNCLKQKEKPFCYLDTHAGNGEYDLLQSDNQEYQEGVLQLQSYSKTNTINSIKLNSVKNTLIKQYLEYSHDLHHFPGSPKIAQKLLRPQDEMILIEKSEHSYQSLNQLFHHQKQIHIHHSDAYVSLRALLPPKIKRGLILIDPPYEEKNEFDKLIPLLKESLKRFSTGIYALWYPIKSRLFIQRFYHDLKKQLNNIEILIAEFCPWSDDVAIRLNGSGMIIINPPWEFEKTLTPLLRELINILRKHPKGFYHIISDHQ